MRDAKTADKMEAVFRAIAKGDTDTLKGLFADAPREELYASFIEMNEALREFYNYTLHLSQGMLSIDPPRRKIFIDAGVKQLHSRLNNLVWQLNQVSHGDFEQRIDYMGELSEGFNWMTGQLRLREAQSAYEMEHDILTGLLNRDAFKRKVFDLTVSSPDETGVMLFAKLDNLKYVNDFYGHDVGDRYIAVAADIFGAFKKLGALAARISGNEFVVYLHGVDSRDEARRTITYLLSQEGKKSIAVKPDRVQKIRFSAGLAWYPDDTPNVAELIKYADYAMHESEKYDEVPFAEFKREIHLNKMTLLEKWESINKLIEEHLIHFAFQPIVDVRDGSVYGYEALMRSKMEDFSSPVEILAVASSQSLLPQIERLTLSLILSWLKENVTLLGEGKLFVNTIASSTMNEREWMELRSSFAELMPCVVFEITEGAVDDEHALVEKTRLIHDEFGAMVALDDYGSGYSGELRLLNLEPDIVKIDRSFIAGIDQDKNRQVMLSNILSFCRSKNIKVLAEGVETAEELETVLNMDIDFVQGYFFARPDFELKPIDSEKMALLSQLNKKRL